MRFGTLGTGRAVTFVVALCVAVSGVVGPKARADLEDHIEEEWDGTSGGHRRDSLDFYDGALIGDENTRANHLGGRTGLLNDFRTGDSRDYSLSVPTARIWAGGFMSAGDMSEIAAEDFHLGGFVQVGLTPPEFENGSPLYDAIFVVPVALGERNQNHWLQFRLGQFFTPFGRMRNLAENQYQVITRSPVVDALAPSRDLGLELTYSVRAHALTVGVFGGEGRNRIDASDSGVMSTARWTYQPFGPVDTRDETTSNTTHVHRRVVSLGASFAYNRRTSRAQGIDATDYRLGTADELHLGLDALYRYRGRSVSAELVYRRSSLGQRSGVDADGNAFTEFGRHGIGYVVQASLRMPEVEYDIVEFYARFSHLIAYRGTDPGLEALAREDGRQLSYGFDLYFTGDHHFKFQFQTSHSFVPDAPNHGRVLIGLEGTFDWAHPVRDDRRR